MSFFPLIEIFFLKKKSNLQMQQYSGIQLPAYPSLGTIKIQKPFFLSVLQSRVNHNNLFANCFSNREYQSAEQRHTILMLPVDETLIYSVMIISLNKTEPMWCLCMQVQKTLNFSKKKINQIYHFLIVIY